MIPILCSRVRVNFIIQLNRLFFNALLVVKYFFFYLFLVIPTLFSMETIYLKISNLLNPSEEDYRILQRYLLEGERPYLDWLNRYIQNPKDGYRYDIRVRDFRLVKEEGESIFEKVYFYTSPHDRDLCIISYASFNGWYPDRIKKLKDSLQKVEFQGHYLYRIGGWPNVEEGSLLLAHVPYAFKLCMFREALSCGYRKILWLDCSFTTLQNLSSLFKMIEDKGYLIVSDPNKFSNYINEKVLTYFNLTFDDSHNVEAVAAGIIGFDFTNENARKIFDTWNTAAWELDGFLSSRPEQNALAAILYKLNLPVTCRLADICAWERRSITVDHILFIGQL